IGSLAGIAVRLTGYLALIWVGFWMGLVGRHVSIAVFATLALAKLGPALASSMAQSTLMSFVLSGKVPAWTPLLLATVTGLGINLGLVALARHQLLPDLRRLLEFPGFVLWPTRSPTPPVLRA
ncbi:MAG: hypothetical protein JNL97_11335, partial [Verrucomicrobiales bacterium]|nr:hypothetical protein [Verrucomicrobiales bacterium]